jgi:hypothetical protein
MSDFSKTIDDIMEPLGFEQSKPLKSTDFHPLPQSEWTDEELEVGCRTVARVNADDPKRLDIFVQYAPAIELVVDFELQI